MKSFDLSSVYKKYKGKWLAFSSNHKDVIAVGETAKEVWDESQKKGHKKPILSHLPQKLSS